MSERCPVADCTPLNATSCVPASTRSRDVFGLESAVAERDLTDVVALAGQLPPGEVVRAVLPLPDHDVVARAGWAELGSNQAGGRGHRRDQRDVGGGGADQPRHRRPGVVGGLFAAAVVEAGGCPLVDELVVGVGEPSAGEADRGSVEVRRGLRRREQATSVADVRDCAAGGRVVTTSTYP